jgi:hypothetical protein
MVLGHEVAFPYKPCVAPIPIPVWLPARGNGVLFSTLGATLRLPGGRDICSGGG